MNVVDMHLNPLVVPDIERVSRVSVEDLQTACRHFAGDFPAASVEQGMMVVLNPRIFDEPESDIVMKSILAKREFAISYAPDLRRTGASEDLDRAHSLGIKALKFHPYIQHIEAADFPAACALACYADSLNMFIMVCCSYGTRALERYSGVRLAGFLSEHVPCPIVMSHAGGAQVLDAMLVAAEAPNLYLDTSFSLPYYIGSSVETDFAFAMRKLGTHRWVYGSDAPFFGLKEALDVTLRFLERHTFTSQDVENVLYATAMRILGGVGRR